MAPKRSPTSTRPRAPPSQRTRTTGTKRTSTWSVEEIGEEPNLTLLVWDESRERDVGTFLQSQFEENLGAKVEVRVLPFDQLVEQTAAGDYDFYHGGSIAAYNDPMDFLEVWTTDSPLNQSGFSNAEYDRLIADAKAATDPTRRFQQLAQAEKILIEDEAVVAPTFHPSFTRLIRPSVEGLVFHPYGVLSTSSMRASGRSRAPAFLDRLGLTLEVSYHKRDYDEPSRLDAGILDRRLNLFIGAARR